MKLNFGIIGLGNIGSRHLKVLNENGDAKVVAVCDTNKAVLNSFASKNILGFTDFKNIIAQKEIDVINICTPHFLHADMAVAALNAGKHVIVEKPMCLTSADAKRMIVASKKNKKKLIVVKQNRYNQPVAAVQQLIKNNSLGKIYDVQCNVWWNRNDAYYQSDWRGKRKTEGGALFTQASHFIDLLVWWFGEIVSAKTLLQTQAHKIEIEDCGHSIVKFKNGATGNINWTTNIFEKNFEGSVTIIAEKGTIKIGGAYLNELHFWNVKGIAAPALQADEVKPNLYKTNYQGSSSHHDKVMSDVVKLILYKQKIEMVEGEEAIKTINSIVKMYNKKNRIK